MKLIWKHVIPLSMTSVAVGLPLNGLAQLHPNDYPIGAGDQLEISVADYPEFTGTKTVSPDGAISLPVVGQVSVVGQSSKQAATRLTTALKQYLRNPVVTVSLSQLRPVSVTIVGEVARPGPVQISANRSLITKEQPPIDLPTVPLALAAAGGVTSKADLQHVQLKRSSQPDVTLDLWSALSQQTTIPANLTVQDGDLIVVPKRPQSEGIDSRLLARSVYAPKTVRVRVVGEVKRPGEADVPPDGTLSAAVAIAGGATDKGKLSRVVLMRRNDAGVLQKRELNLSNATDDPQVQDGDVLIVPMKGGVKLLDTLGQIISPVGILLNLLR